MFENLIRKYYVDNIELNIGSGGKIVATDDIGGVQHELVKIEYGTDGNATMVSPANPLPTADAAALAALVSIASEDFATQTTLAALLAKVIAAPSTEAKQDAIITLLTNIDAGTAAALGQALMAASVPVVIASNQSPISVTDSAVAGKSATATLSNVNDTASNVTLLALNANRLGATIYNDSTEILYVKLGATASTTSFTVRMLPQDYYELPFRYTGIIEGIWAANASGAARLTEFTA